ncbi:hypothetical protein Tco_0579645 [Tanacetum coccineum]
MSLLKRICTTEKITSTSQSCSEGPYAMLVLVMEENMICFAGVDVVVPVESIRAISERFANAAYGFFLGKRVAYLIVANYVRNTWGKYGLIKSMLNSSTGIFSFQFSSMEGLVMMLENDPWFIHNNPLILKKWNLECSSLG